MRMYLIKATLYAAGNSFIPWDITLEGDDLSVGSGDWSSSGPGIAWVSESSGNWEWKDEAGGPTVYLKTL